MTCLFVGCVRNNVDCSVHEFVRQIKATLVVVQCKGRESCIKAEPGLSSHPSRAACHKNGNKVK